MSALPLLGRLVPRRGAPAVLAACALAIQRRESVPQLLRNLSQSDPVLRFWVQRLIPQLEHGQSLVSVLARQGLLTKAEARVCRAAEEHSALAEVLSAIADNRQQRLPDLWLWRWFPALVVVAILGGGVWAHRLLGFLSDNAFGRIFMEIGLDLPMLSDLAFAAHFASAIVVTGLCLLAVVLALKLGRACKIGRYLGVVAGMPLQRTYTAIELIHWGRIAQRAAGQGMQVPAKSWRGVWRLHCWILLINRLLTRKQLRQIRQQAPDADDLPGRLLALGLVQRSDVGIDWDDALRVAHMQLAPLWLRMRTTAGFLLFVLAFYAFCEIFIIPIYDTIAWRSSLPSLGGSIGGLMISVGSAWIAFAVLNDNWLPSRFIRGGYSPVATRAVADRLRMALMQGRNPGVAMQETAQLLDGLTASRCRRFQAHYQAHNDLPTAIEQSRLLPPGQRRLVQAAAAVDVRLIAPVLQRYALGSGMVVSYALRNALSMLRVALPLLALVALFMLLVIVPRWMWIMEEFPVALQPLTAWVFTASDALRMGFMFPAIAICLVIAVVFLPTALPWWWHAWQPLRSRLDRAQLLLDGAALGLPESSLASLIQAPKDAHFSDLVHTVSGKRENPATTLSLAQWLEQAQRRYDCLSAYATAALLMGIWLLLVALVATLVFAIFLPLIDIMMAVL